MLVRKTTVSGMFYPSDKLELSNLIEYFLDKVEIPKNLYNKDIKAVVSPHAGYIYSGHVSAYSYKTILKNWNKISLKTFVLLCPSHYVNLHKVAIGMFNELETPLGNLTVDKQLGNKLLEYYPDFFTNELRSFTNEHSLETQLPFLKYIAGKQDIKVLPLIFGDVDYEEFGKILNTLYKNNNIFFIVSSDLSHYKNYNTAIEIDNNTIKNFLSMNTRIIEANAEACGIYPWLTLNEIAKLNNWNPRMLKYANSGDTAGSKDKVVGYTSIIYL